VAITPDSGGGGAVTAATTSFTIDITSAADGSDVFVWVQWGLLNCTFTATGWTQIGPLSTDSTMTCVILYRRKVAGDTTFTVTPSGSAKGSHQWQSYTGLDSTTPYQAATTAGNLLKKNTSGTAIPTPSVTNTDATSWALAFFASRSSTASQKAITFTPDPALVERRDGNNSAASSGIWTGGEIADSNAAVTAAAHDYTATASFSETHGVGGLLYLNPAAASGPVTVNLGQPAETDTSAALTAAKTDSVGQPLEGDTAAPVGVSKVRATGQPVEPDTSAPLASSKTLTVGQPASAATSSALAPAKTVTLGLPVETDGGLALTVSTGGAPVTKTLGQPAETASTQQLTPAKTRGLGQPAGGSTAFALAGAKTVTLGLPLEVSSSQQLGLAKTRTVGLPGTLEVALVVARAKAGGLGVAVETSTALRIPPLVVLPVPASRTLVVEQEARARMVAAEDRVLVAATEDRTRRVHVENRTISARGEHR
jgi:hypothetical protein